MKATTVTVCLITVAPPLDVVPCTWLELSNYLLDGWTDGWMDGQTDGRTDGWMDKMDQ